MRHIPNALSASRILVSFVTIPFLFQWFGSEFQIFGIDVSSFSIALALCVYAGMSDFLDGFIARRFGYESATGANLDQLADKIWSWPIILSLMILSAVPWWFVAIVAVRDGGILYLRNRLKQGGTSLRVSFFGKLKAALLFVYICSSVLVLMNSFPSHAHLVFSIVMAFMVGLSGTHYFFRDWKTIKASFAK